MVIHWSLHCWHSLEQWLASRVCKHPHFGISLNICVLWMGRLNEWNYVKTDRQLPAILPLLFLHRSRASHSEGIRASSRKDGAPAPARSLSLCIYLSSMMCTSLVVPSLHLESKTLYFPAELRFSSLPYSSTFLFLRTYFLKTHCLMVLMSKQYTNTYTHTQSHSFCGQT